MALTLYGAFVPTIQQTLGAIDGVLQKAQVWCAETGMTHDALAGLRLHETMWPFSFQIRSVAHHSIGAIQAVRSGEFDVTAGDTAEDLAGMRGLVQQAIAYALSREAGVDIGKRDFLGQLRIRN